MSKLSVYMRAVCSKMHTGCLVGRLNSSKKVSADIAKTVRIDKDCKIIARPGTALKVGENVSLGANSEGYHAGMPFPTKLLLDKPGASIEIGDNCRLNGVYVHAQASIKIGKNCVMASGVNIIDSNGHELISPNRTSGRDNPKPIEIGNNVWVGLNAIILKGTTIGDNSVVAAGSVAKGEYPANSLIQGNPAVAVSTLPIE